ncbi:MAG: cupin domain-containing protein [Anaerolineae bacterium]|nr:cupin domain-containing protein [Anaerolineae bacterium]
MIEIQRPFSRTIALDSGHIIGASVVTYRRLSDMRGWFADAQAEAALLPENPLIYEVHYGYNTPSVDGQLGFGTTILYPGTIGGEYYMTKGHYHRKADRAEIYYGLSGEGELLLQTRDGETTVQHISPGVVAYIPAYHAHRTINTSAETFVFLSIYPADAGNDYESVAALGFASLLVERDGKPELIASPRYHA